MIGELVCLAIPYKTFKEKIKITKKYKNQEVQVYKNFILINIKKV